MTRAVTETDFDAVVLQSEIPVLVDFWAPWCAPCKKISPIVDDIGTGNVGRLDVVKLNIDESPAIAARYGVTAIPTLAVFSGGEVVQSITGLKSKAALLADLANFVA